MLGGIGRNDAAHLGERRRQEQRVEVGTPLDR